MSTEFMIARITAQSKNADPKQIKGGLPEFTADDIRHAAAKMRPRSVHDAFMAKYAQSDIAVVNLAHRMDAWGHVMFRKKYPARRISDQEHKRITDLAVMYFLNPEAGQRRTDGGSARYIGCGLTTWQQKFYPHFKSISAELFGLESLARQQFAKYLKK